MKARTLTQISIACLTVAVAIALIALVEVTSGCGMVRYVPPHLRSIADQELTAVSVSSSCVLNDPTLQPGESPDLPHDHFTQLWGRIGSGVIVDERHVLTAYHITTCPDFPAVDVVLSDGRHFFMAVQKEDEGADLALLVISSADYFHVNVAPPIVAGPPVAGDALCVAAAYPRREWHCGFVDSVHDDARGPDVELIASSKKGNSGGASYDSLGRLVGISSLGSKTNQEWVGITSLSKHMEIFP